jgi:hypothetical protein
VVSALDRRVLTLEAGKAPTVPDIRTFDTDSKTYHHCLGYADAMAWVRVWIKQERDQLRNMPIHPRHTRRLKARDLRLMQLDVIDRRVKAAYEEASEAATAAESK